ncbi:MAG: hypothetical protein AAF492_24930 [Verrucomicrobiota bacterium]
MRFQVRHRYRRMESKETRIVDKQGGPAVLLALGFIVLLCISLRTISHPECWTNLSLGRSIVENGIPRTDALTLPDVVTLLCVCQCGMTWFYVNLWTID